MSELSLASSIHASYNKISLKNQSNIPATSLTLELSSIVVSEDMPTAAPWPLSPVCLKYLTAPLNWDTPLSCDYDTDY